MEHMSRTSRLNRRHMGMDDEDEMFGMSLTWYPKVYWAVVGSVIAAFTLVNALNHLLYWQRLRAATENQPSSARPKAFLSKLYATLTAVARELFNSSLPSFQLAGVRWTQPTFGKLVLVLINIAVAIALCFNTYDIHDTLSFENIGWECGLVSVAQVPLIFLLAGKNNIVGFLIGLGHERLNWLHRWAARTLLITTTIHMGYWFASWAEYDLIAYYLQNDAVAKKGLISWAILLWIVLSSFAPIRGLSYEIFVIQHTLSYIALITMIFLHTPSHVHGFLWAPVAIYLFDRGTRALYAAYINLSIFHPRRRAEGNSGGMWTCRAELSALPWQATRVTIKDPPISWKAGQHVFFSCHTIAPLQSHPFTISSLPEDGKLEFYIRAYKGGTKRLLDYAQKHSSLPSGNDSRRKSTVAVMIDGPYGRMRPLRQFDSVALFAGSTGATFTVPQLRDIVRRWKAVGSAGLPPNKGWLSVLRAPEVAITRRVDFVWAVKSRRQIEWFQQELNEVAESVQRPHGMSVNISIYITCDDSLTADWNNWTAKASNRDRIRQIETTDSPSSDSVSSGEKGDKDITEQVSVIQIDPRAESSPATACSQDDACCCKAKAEVDGQAYTCTCHDGSQARIPRNMDNKSEATCDQVAVHHSTSLHPGIKLRSGRPALGELMRDMLEAARGESAVVSCGPRSMNDECRRTVVALSDERAVHKGTGAQGIYYWGEGYGYA